MKSYSNSRSEQTAAAVTPQPSAVLQRKCACGGSAGPGGECEECKRKNGRRLQTKRPQIDPDDGLEREADQVAERVVTGGASMAQPVSVSSFSGIQRRGTEGVAGEQTGMVDQVLQSPGERLNDDTRKSMEVRFGHNFGDVRVHRDALAAQSAQALRADAYTVGTHITFAPGLFAPETASGQRLIAHELTHVLQQRGGGGEQLNVQRQPSDPVLLSDPAMCEGRVNITQQFNDFVRDVPGLIQQIPNATQQQKMGLTDMARYVFEPDGAADLSGFTILCCSQINSGLVMGRRESAQAYIDPAHSELGMITRVFNLMGQFRTTLDKEVLTQFLQVIAHEKRHLNLAGVFQVSESALRPGRSSSAARNAEYRAEEILAIAEEIFVGRMALGPDFVAERDVQERLFRSRNMIRGWVTEEEFQRLRGIIIRQLRAKYGFEDGCDNQLVVGVVRSMDRNEWFSCNFETGGIHGPVPEGLNVCTDERHRFCRRRSERTPTGP